MPPAADGRLRYDPPGRFSQWPEPLELQGHAFGFDWWKNAVLRARAYNCQDNTEQVRVEARMPPRQTTVSVRTEVNSIESKAMCEPDAKATAAIGRLKPEWEYLFVPSRRQRGRDKAGHGWRLRQLEPDEIASRFESTTEQVVQISPNVYVTYPVQWLTAAVKPEYITVSLLQGSEVLCWQYLVEESVLDSSIGGCHVQLPMVPVLYSGEHLFDAVSVLLIQSGAIHDVAEHLDEAILQQEVFDEAQQQALYDEHWPRLSIYHLNSREGSESSDASSVSEIEVEHLSLCDWRELNRAFRTWAQACWHNDLWHYLCIRAFQG